MNKEYAESLLKKTRNDYNLIAEEFSRTRRNPWEEIEFLFDRHLAFKDKVLDLGCGNGRYLDFFKKKDVDYVGVDGSEKLVEIAKNRYPGFHFIVADALNLPFPENAFDKIYSIAVLHHIPSMRQRLAFLGEARRVLKENGIFILTVWKFHRFQETLLILKYMFLRLLGISNLDWGDVFESWGKKTKRYYHCFSQKELIGLAEKAGFRVKEAGVIENQRGNRRNVYIVAQK